MQDYKQIEEAAKALGLKELAPEIYKDMLQPATRQIGDSLATVAKAVNVALAPLEAGVWGYERIREWLSIRATHIISERNIPNINSPPLSIAGPIIQNLLFAIDEPELKELYASLLCSSMDPNGASHPAFVSIIQQLTSDEALIIKYLSQQPEQWPVISELTEVEGEAIDSIEEQFKEWCKLSNVKNIDHYKSYMDNLIRLRLLSFLCGNNAEPNSSEYFFHSESITNKEYAHLELSSFGRQFIDACIEK